MTSPVSMPAGHKMVATDFDAYENATAAWTTWSPTLTNLTLSNGTQIAKYRQVGKTVDFIWSFVLGSTSSVGTSPAFTLAVAPSTNWAFTGNTLFPTNCVAIDAGNAEWPGETRLSGSTVSIFYKSTISAVSNITATAPFTWGTGDGLLVCGTYYTA
jgi:hypothetical protein